MSKRDDNLLIEDILEAASKIIDYTNDLDYKEFSVDEKTKDAVIRNFEIIGEAAGRLSNNFKGRHSNIEWNRLRGFRNRIVHDYFGVDYGIVWTIIDNDLILLIETLRNLTNEE